MKRKISLFVALIFLVATMLSTMVISPTVAAAADPLITVKMFIGDPVPAATPDNKIYKMIEKEFGIKFDIEALVGDLNQRLGIMIASGDFPDIVAGDSKLITSKSLIPLESMITKSKTPLLKEYLDPYMKKLTYDTDGHLYIIPNWGRYYGDTQTAYFNGNGFYMQKGVLKEFGYPKVRTLDQYFDLVEKYKKKYPTIDGKPTIGYSFLTYDWRSFCLKNAPAQAAGYPNDGGVVVDWKTHKAKVYANDVNISKPYFKKLNELNAKGILDREAFTDNYDQYMAKVSSGRVIAKFAALWQDQAAEDTLTSEKKYERNSVCLPITYSTKIQDRAKDVPEINKNRGIGISRTSKYAERIIKFVEGSLSDKWQKIHSWGIEGQEYSLKNGEPVRTDKQRTEQKDQAWKNANRADALKNMIPHHMGKFKDGTCFAIEDNKTESKANLTDFDKEFLAAYKIDRVYDLLYSPKDNLASYPAWNIDLIAGSPAAKADTKIGDLQIKWLPRIIMAKPSAFNSEWNAYMNAFKKIKDDVAAYEKRINEEVSNRFKLFN